MDAWTVVRTIAICVVLLARTASAASTPASEGGYRTSNFIVHAPSQEIAKRVGDCAEFWREELAVDWLGKKLPNWFEPCQVTVQVGQIGAGGATTFSFDGGEVFGWRMRVQGTLERILDSVVPHEVSHTIFACHFRRPLPRWADEGAATLVEHISERKRQSDILQQVTRSHDRIPLSQLLQIDEYPKDMQKVLALYAEGYSLADFLVKWHGDRGKQVYLAFLKDALATNWESAFRKHYGFQTLADLDQQWDRWLVAGSPEIRRDDAALALATQPVARPTANSVIAMAANTPPPAKNEVTVRGQSEAPVLDQRETPSITALPLPRMNRPLRVAANVVEGSANVARPMSPATVARSENAPSPRSSRAAIQPAARTEQLIPLQLDAPEPALK